MRFSLFLIILILLCGSASAESEITFQNIPWLTSETETVKQLFNLGIVREQELNEELAREGCEYIIFDEAGIYRPYTIRDYEEVCFAVLPSPRGRIAGYPIKQIKLTFAYDGDYKLISVSVDMIGADYDELKEKLVRVYGDGQYSRTNEGIESLMWKGDNNSGVLLYTESEGLEFTLIYGRIDAEEILNNCRVSNPDDVSGL